ncbi:unnamed protein product [Clonostachys chloroleuca]|uniref:Xylanolytic transcriptional activator regulatory domain-containing protein n=1 Tax=Clonostachys chloroleuca TaxID=1926264 RepID=A0AA35LUT5_9HYPO|nr:unnamed protein product [Clonostachys chloroleuca]
MAQRLQEAEKQLAEMRSGRESTPASESGGGATTDQGFRPVVIPAHPAVGTVGHLSPTRPPATNSTHHPSPLDTGAGNTAFQSSSGIASHTKQTPAARDTRTMPQDSALTDVSVDEHGEICYYGPTSAVHDPPQLDSPLSLATSATNPSVSSKADARSAVAAFARESATWEDFALGNASLETGIPRAVLAKLLHVHWAWVSPMFTWVYRPAFVRDMATGGRYYSEFLLTVICSHAAKYQDGEYADMLLARARRLLGNAIQEPSSIPTVQALLQLSARDLAQGSISRAWVYSGIAFRMASDLGLQHSGPDLRGMGAIDLEVRRRHFWSCYFWDKATSLYAGRLPAVTEVLHPDTLDLLDDSTDLDIWSPYYGNSLNLTKFTQNQYPPMRNYAVSTFVSSCKLSMIIHDIIVQLYYRRNRTNTEETIKDVKSRLDSWRENSPRHLRYDPDHLPTICPPPHIISQNLLYFTTVILTHRPFWSIPSYYKVCISASRSIEALVLLLESTFGLENITYLMGYCIYTGASAILEDAKCNKGPASQTLKTYLRALNAGMKTCPLLERSLQIIVKGLNRYPSSSSMNLSGHSQSQGVAEVDFHLNAATANSYIPAFPYLGPDMSMDFCGSSYLGNQNPDSMSMLDCFPEMQTDFGELLYTHVD